MALAERVRALRTVRGWNQVDLARESGVDQGSISKIERGKALRPSHESLVRLARAFGISVEELTDGSPVDNTEPILAAYIAFLYPHLDEMPARAREQAVQFAREDYAAWTRADLAHWSDRLRQEGVLDQESTAHRPGPVKTERATG